MNGMAQWTYLASKTRNAKWRFQAECISTQPQQCDDTLALTVIGRFAFTDVGRGNQIGIVGGEALGPSLARLTALTDLDLWYAH